MSAHPESHDADHAAPAAPAASHAAPAAAPHAAPHAAPSQGGYFSNAFARIKSGVKNAIGAVGELGKAVYDTSAPRGQGWAKSMLQPVGHGIMNFVGRPFTALGTLVYHEGQWINPGKAWHEAVNWVTDPFHQAGTIVKRGFDAVDNAYHRGIHGVEQLATAPAGQARGYSTANTFLGEPMPPSARYNAKWGA